MKRLTNTLNNCKFLCAIWCQDEHSTGIDGAGDSGNDAARYPKRLFYGVDMSDADDDFCPSPRAIRSALAQPRPNSY